MHHQQQVRIVDRRHRHEVLHQRERLFRDQRFVDRVGVRHHQQRVAVRRRFRHEVGADDRAGAGAVLDDERLSQRLLQLLAEIARVDVGRAAGAERHDDAYRFRGISLRLRGSAHQNGSGQ